MLQQSFHVLLKTSLTVVSPGGIQLICNNMVTSTRAIVNTARSMVSTIMKFLDSGSGKTSDGNLKARVMTSEPDNAEGLHNFAPLGETRPKRWCDVRNECDREELKVWPCECCTPSPSLLQPVHRPA